MLPLTVFTLLSSPSTAAQAEIPELTWNWDAPQRLYVESEVKFGEFFWINAANNKNARLIGLQIRAVIDCEGDGPTMRRKTAVRCTFEDIGLQAGGHPGDRGIVQPILDEYDALYTDGAALELVFRDDGRIINVDLVDVPTRNLRTRARAENMRLLARYLVAGIEVPVSRNPGREVWVSRESLLCTLPTRVGTVGPAEAVHKAVVREDKEGRVEIASAGRGLMQEGDSANAYTCEFEARALFDPVTGLDHRTWDVTGEPTPGSPIAFGFAGYTWTQHGSVRRLGPDETVDVGETREVVPTEEGPSAIQQGRRSNPDPTDPSVR